MNAKITQGKRQLWQWDTGVQLMLFDIGSANEVHFATPDGVIRRDIVNNMCNIPDVVLQRAGTMVCYVFNREPYEGDTRHEFHFEVLPRPKPADYIDPPGEADYLDQLYDRLKDEIVGPPGPQGEQGPAGPEGLPGKDGVGISTLEQVRYTTADGGMNTWKATLTDGTYSLFNVTNGSKGSTGEPGPAGPHGLPGTSVSITSISESTEDDGYSVVTFSDGKQLRVKNGSKGESGESGADMLIVETEHRNGILYADKTASEISEALNAGHVCMLRYGDAVLSFYGWHDNHPAFAGVPYKAFPTIRNTYYVNALVVQDDGSVDTTLSGEIEAINPYPLVFEGGVQVSYNGFKETRINIDNVVNNALIEAKKSGDFKGDPGASVTITSISQNTEDDGYSVVTFSDGKTLRVKNGSKGSPGEGGSGGGVVTVYCQPSDDMQSFTASMTVEEIIEAFAQGKAVQAVVLGMGIVAHAFMVTEDVVLFSGVASIAGESMAVTLNMMADGTNAMSVAPLGSMVVVNITTEDGETYTADRNAGELYAAISAGMPVYASLMGMYIPAHRISDGEAVFRVVYTDGTVTVRISTSAYAEVEVAPAGGGGDSVIVQVTETMNGAYEADMTADAIYTIHTAGARVVCHVVPSAGIEMFLSPIVVTEVSTLFAGIFDAQGQYMKSVSVTVTNDPTAIVTETPLDKVPNPKPLTINGTSYDGSEAVNIDIAGGGGGSKWELIETITISSDVTSINRTKDLNGATYSLAAAMIRADCGATATGGYVRVYFRGTSSYIEIHIDAAVGGTSLSWTAECCQEGGMMMGRATTPRNGSRDAASYIPPRYGYDFIPAEPIKKIELVTNSKFTVGTKIEIWGVRA